MSKQWYRAFADKYPRLTRRLETKVVPYQSDDTTFSHGIEYNALWDTGADASVITRRIEQELNLLPVGTNIVAGVNSKSNANITLVTVELPQLITVKDASVYVCDLPGEIDMLLGIDIISRGDFVICNADNQTWFSFAYPPFKDKLNLVERANAFNDSKKVT